MSKKDSVRMRDTVNATITRDANPSNYPCPRCGKETYEDQTGWRKCSSKVCEERFCVLN